MGPLMRCHWLPAWISLILAVAAFCLVIWPILCVLTFETAVALGLFHSVFPCGSEELMMSTLSLPPAVLLAAWFYRGLRWKNTAWDGRHCLTCAYDLRGQTEPRCPECGKRFDPGLLAKNVTAQR